MVNEARKGSGQDARLGREAHIEARREVHGGAHYYFARQKLADQCCPFQLSLMNEQEAQAEINRLAKAGIDAVMVIVVFGRTDEEHRYSVKVIY